MALEAAEFVQARLRRRPSAAVILGSGLGALADRVQDPDILPYAEIPHFSTSTVPGHAGRLVVGELGSTVTAIMQGRVHFYEGYSPSQITLPVRLLWHLGVKTLLLTNAAGGIGRHLAVGDLMAIVDHINLPGIAGNHPLRGPNDDSLGPRFPEMSTAYDRELLAQLRDCARQRNIVLKEGVYAMASGPSFETPAEVRFLRTIGADAVGMSTVPEVIVARHAGMRVLAISLITNIAIDSLAYTGAAASHEEVLSAGNQALPRLATLIEDILRQPLPPTLEN
jgi:purine-nucleoside phosphorylase